MLRNEQGQEGEVKILPLIASEAVQSTTMDGRGRKLGQCQESKKE